MRVIVHKEIPLYPKAGIRGFIPMGTPPRINISQACAGIYAIVNAENSKGYVGSSLNVKERLQTHKRILASGRHENIYLQRAYDKSPNRFHGGVLQIVKQNAGESNQNYYSRLRRAEQEWIDQMRSCDKIHGYNINPNATCPPNLKGHKFSQKTCEKRSASRKAMYQKMRDAGIKIKGPMDGKKMPKASILKTIESRKNNGKKSWQTGLTKNDHPGIMLNSIKKIGNTFGRFGKGKKRGVSEKRSISQTQFDDVVLLRSEGKTLSEIAKIFGCTATTICHYVNLHKRGELSW